ARRLAPQPLFVSVSRDSASRVSANQKSAVLERMPMFELPAIHIRFNGYQQSYPQPGPKDINCSLVMVDPRFSLHFDASFSPSPASMAMVSWAAADRNVADLCHRSPLCAL